MPALKTLPLRVKVQADRIQTAPLAISWRSGISGANARGYNYRWQQRRLSFLREHPLCMCEECDGGRLQVKIATVIDHKTPHRGNADLFWNEGNWVPMNVVCHNRKTAKGE